MVTSAKNMALLALTASMLMTGCNLHNSAQTWVNNGINDMSDDVVSISSDPLAQYDDAQVVGMSVLTALNTYCYSSDYAVIICNRSSGNPYTSTPKNFVNLFGQNYCAKLKRPSTDIDTAELYDTGVYWSNDANQFLCSGLDLDEPESNTNFRPTNDESNEVTYVNQNSQWYANIIYDESTNEACGILFRELVPGDEHESITDDSTVLQYNFSEYSEEQTLFEIPEFMNK